ncbi:MAG: GTP cyclohydrolase FolE2, partial [Myxococcaceae bacterium]
AVYIRGNPMLKDVQGSPDTREIALDHAGVSDLRYPIVVLDRCHEKQRTVASISMSVGLPHHFKGTHMSRFIEVLNSHRGEVTMRTLPAILAELQSRLDAASARVEVRFPYFLERKAPVTGASALMDYDCWFIGSSASSDRDFILGARVPVTSLCPCSKEISDYGAHNQRGYITIEVRGETAPSQNEVGKFVWLEELIELAEASASAPVFPLVKRPDERHITMQAYDNPVFVEDMVRNVALRLRDDPRVSWFRVHAKNDESIHNHNAFASLEWRRERGGA